MNEVLPPEINAPEIQLDKKPTGKEEELNEFLTPEQRTKQLKNRSLQQNIDERKKFADRAYKITVTWIVFLIILTLFQFFFKYWNIGLSDKEFMVVFTTTTASVFGFWVLVGKYLFNPRAN